MKEQVTKFDITAAFKALDEIEVPVVKGIMPNKTDLKESCKRVDRMSMLVEEYYDVNSPEELEEAQGEREDEIAKAKLARIEKIVDLDADSPEDLLPSYVGKIIIQCPQCMTLFYKDETDLVKDENDPEIVNVNEACQHCGNISGYTVIGKVGAADEDEMENFETEEETSTEDGELDLDFDLEETPEGEEEVAVKETEVSEEPADEESSEEEVAAESEEDEEKKEESFVKPVGSPLTEGAEEECQTNEEEVEESLNNSELLKDCEKGSELKTENESENLTLNEGTDKDLNALLDKHNQYIAYLQKLIQQDEEALERAKKMKDADEVVKAIEKRLAATKEDLEAALPDAVKANTQADDLPTPEEADVKVEEETEVEESLHNSELLKDCEKKSDLKTENESENLTLNEGAAEANLQQFLDELDMNESMENEIKVAEFERSLPEGCEGGSCEKTELPECNETPAAEEITEAQDVSDAEFKSLISSPVFNEGLEDEEEIEMEEELNPGMVQSTIDRIADAGEEIDEPIVEEEFDFEDVDEIDEASLDEHFTAYLQEVYSNVKDFNTTACKVTEGKLVVEGTINFNSGNAKNTTFVFESHNNKKLNPEFTGINEDLAEGKAFTVNS